MKLATIFRNGIGGDSLEIRQVESPSFGYAIRFQHVKRVSGDRTEDRKAAWTERPDQALQYMLEAANAILEKHPVSGYYGPAKELERLSALIKKQH